MNYNNQSFIPENSQIHPYLICAPHDLRYQNKLINSCNELWSKVNDFQRYNVESEKILQQMKIWQSKIQMLALHQSIWFGIQQPLDGILLTTAEIWDLD